MNRFYITTAIPYVNAEPHVGFALELVQADVLARHRRLRGDEVRFLSGTDDHALKNLQAARSAGIDVRAFVAANAAAFVDLRTQLDISTDDFIHTSTDPRHRPAVERLWRACRDAGDLYRQPYDGWYCSGCEVFLEPAAALAGGCPEHPDALIRVTEENWFFRASRYTQQVRDAIAAGRVRVQPDERRREVQALLDTGLRDFSVSRDARRGAGFGIPVPDDPTQVVYVWFDALANYISAVGFGQPSCTDYQHWWCNADDRVHVIGKGITRQHAAVWTAMLLSAGEPLPTRILVHDYLTVSGRKIAKTGAATTRPVDVIAAYGADALRWWLIRTPPRCGDADFRVARVVARANTELANGIGNLVSRTRRLAEGVGLESVVVPAVAAGLVDAAASLATRIDHALDVFDLRRASDALVAVVSHANALIDHTRIWQRPVDDQLRRGVVQALRGAVDVLGHELSAFVPDTAARILSGHTPVFPRLALSGPPAQSSAASAADGRVV